MFIKNIKKNGLNEYSQSLKKVQVNINFHKSSSDVHYCDASTITQQKLKNKQTTELIHQLNDVLYFAVFSWEVKSVSE